MPDVSQWALMLVKKYEGCSLEAYPDPCSPDGHPVTIGYGHTGPEVELGQVIDQATAEEFLRSDMAKVARRVSELTGGLRLTQGQFDALCCFAFNVGTDALRASSLLRKLREGDEAGAANELLRWVHVGGKVVRGLTARRLAERSLFLGQI